MPHPNPNPNKGKRKVACLEYELLQLLQNKAHLKDLKSSLKHITDEHVVAQKNTKKLLRQALPLLSFNPNPNPNIHPEGEASLLVDVRLYDGLVYI
jgi:hypothetical protein